MNYCSFFSFPWTVTASFKLRELTPTIQNYRELCIEGRGSMASKNCSCKDSTIVEGIFGEIQAADNGPSSGDFQSWSAGDGETTPTVIKSFTLSNSNRMEVVVITWGATIVSLKCPDKYGRSADIVLGFEDLQSKQCQV